MFVHCCIVCVAGRADKQAMVWEVEGLHRLRLLTQVWQNVTRSTPRNPAGGVQGCNLIPSIQHGAAKNTQSQAARDGALSIRITLLVPFFFLLCNNQPYGDFFSSIYFPVSLSDSCCLALSHSLCLCLRTAY